MANTPPHTFRLGKKLKAAVKEQAHDERLSLSKIIGETVADYASGKDLHTVPIPEGELSDQVTHFLAPLEVVQQARIRGAQAGENYGDVVREALAYRARAHLS